MRKMMKIVIFAHVYICLLFGYTLEYPLSKFSFYLDNDYHRIKTVDFTLNGRPGTPELPVAYLNYIIPPDAQVESLFISSYNMSQIAGRYTIYPAQVIIPLNDPQVWTPPDTTIYNSDDLFPGELIKIVDSGVFDGARIATIAFYPIQYKPLTKRLFIVHNIIFNFAFKITSPPSIRAEIRGKHEQKIYNNIFNAMVENNNEIPAYYHVPNLVEENQLGLPGSAPYPVAPAVIITPDAFKPYFQPYVEWLTDQGIRTITISPQTIYTYFNGIDNAERVRNYIKHCYQTAGGTYFILGGDDYTVPIRYAIPYDIPPYPPTHHDSIPCDLYFSDLSGDWDCDYGPGYGDGYWGEISHDQADRFPEVYVGRITAYTQDEVNNWVTKALHYEKTPGVMFSNASWIYSSCVGLGDAPQVFPGHITKRYCANYNSDEAMNEINQGYAFLNVNCHGDIGRFRTNHNPIADIENWWAVAPGPNKAGLNWLTNYNKYFVGYSISCYCGAFDELAWTEPWYPNGSDTCIADAFVDAYELTGSTIPIGCCAYLVNTRNGLMNMGGNGGPSHDLQYEFWDRIFRIEELPPSEPTISKIGVAEAYSKCGSKVNWNSNGYRYICYAHNLFGSPYCETWTKNPDNMNVTHLPSIPAGIESRFIVTVTDARFPPTVLPYAKVCINKPNDIYEVKSTDINGLATFVITPQEEGIIKVTVTRVHNIDNYQQYKPSETYCEVISGRGGEQSSNSISMVPATLCFLQTPTVTHGNINICFGMPYRGSINITLYDIKGSALREIQRDNLYPGYHKEKMDTPILTNGIYFIILKHNDSRISTKIVFIE